MSRIRIENYSPNLLSPKAGDEIEVKGVPSRSVMTVTRVERGRVFFIDSADSKEDSAPYDILAYRRTSMLVTGDSGPPPGELDPDGVYRIIPEIYERMIEAAEKAKPGEVVAWSKTYNCPTVVAGATSWP